MYKRGMFPNRRLGSDLIWLLFEIDNWVKECVSNILFQYKGNRISRSYFFVHICIYIDKIKTLDGTWDYTDLRVQVVSGTYTRILPNNLII